MFKVFDPIVQSLLIVYFLYSLGSPGGIPYTTLFFVIIGIQVVSAILNFFFQDPKISKNLRGVYLAIITFFLIFYAYFQNSVKERYIALDVGDAPTLPLHETVLMSVGILIAFAYTVLCYKELKKMWGAINRGNG